jgi:uncharacterized membrane protein
MKEARIGAFLGYAFILFFMIINLILIMNLIVARLASTYKKYNQRRHLLVHLNTLHVREVSEADDKYSAMVSAPFPMNILHFFTAPILINKRKQTTNLVILHMYYLPIAILSFAVFAVYSLVIIPFCYVKMVGHKFALMVVSPQGQGARSTLDRAGHAVLFLGVGPAILVFNWIVDLWWFILHLYKMDLEKTNNYKNSEATSSTIEINRRTYKKMLEYFSLKNE